MWTQKTGWGKPYFLHESISQPEFLFLSIPVMFVPLFIPDAERRESGSNLNSWPKLSVSPPWGGETLRLTDEKQLKPNPRRLLFVRGLFGHRRGFGGKVNSCSHAAVTASLIMFVVHQGPQSWSCMVFVLCIVQMKPGIFRLSVLCFFVERLRRVQRVSAYKKQTTNLYCNNILGLFGRWLGGFLLHWVFVTVLYPILLSAAK